MQRFGATIKFDLNFCALNGIAQTNLVAFSMKMSRACSGTLSSENDDFKFFKTAKKYKMNVHHVHHSSRARGTVLSLQTSLLLTRNMNVTVAKELYYIFSQILKFRCW